MSTRHRALGALLVVTVIWGATFYWMKQAITASIAHLVPEAADVASGLFVGLRFSIAALLLPVFVKRARHLRGLNGGLFRDAGGLGVLLALGFLLQMVAIGDLSPAVSAFLTSLYVIFTAFISLFSSRYRQISRALLAGVLLATLGAAFISGPPQLHFDLAEWLTVLCAFLFASSIVVTDQATNRHAPDLVSLVSYTTVGLIGWIYLAFTMQRAGAPSWEAVASVCRDFDFLLPMLMCSLLATLFALTLLNHFQKHVSPVRAATLYSLEPVWAAAISLGLGGEVVDGWLFFGAGALLAGNFVAEFGPKRRLPAIKQIPPPSK